MDRRIEVGEFPLISGDLSAGMLKLFEQHEEELLFCEFGIDDRERNCVEGEVPCGEPGILPLVRHGKHTHRVKVALVPVAVELTRCRRRVTCVIAVEPACHIE